MSGLGFDPADAPGLQRGSADQDWVAYLQQVLVSLDYPCGSADGDFGPLTESMVAEFQRSRGLSATGVVDYDTWAALGSALDGGDSDSGASGSSDSSGDSSGNYGFEAAGWHGSAEQQTEDGYGGSGDEMSYLVPEEDQLGEFGIHTSIERSGDHVVAYAQVTNIGTNTITDVELTVSVTSGYGRQENASVQAASLPPSQGVEAGVQIEIAGGDENYTMVVYGVGNNVLPVTHADTITIDQYDQYD
jgi:peptidoglycan hydrolase-like protein with peptidoglycan-binding domain